MTTGKSRDLAIEAVVELLLAELERQSEDGRPGPYVSALAGKLDQVIVDGEVDLVALAAAIFEVVDV